MAKLIFTGDWHIGRDNDSTAHNEYMSEFVEWMIEWAENNGVEEIHQIGDYFDNRNRMSLQTIHYGLQIAKKLHAFSGPTTVLVGNHDIYYKNRLDVASTAMLEGYTDVIGENEFRKIGGKEFLFAPWIVDDEAWDATVNDSKDVDYVIGHFEFRNFKMNENYIMEHGLSHRELKHVKRVITGHYHGRQLVDNVIYVGSPFQFDFNDANDHARGFMVLDTETDEIEFIDWDRVSIKTVKYDEFLKIRDTLDEHTSIRIDLPDDADDKLLEEAREAVEGLSTRNSKINYKGNKSKALMEASVEINEVSDIDQSIRESILAVDEAPSDVDLEMLVSLFNEAVAMDQQEYTE